MLSTETRTRFLPTVSRLRRRPLLVHILLLILLLVLSGLYGVYLGADRSWDLLNYHYYIPYAFLHARLGFDIQPAQAQTYLNPLLDLPFYVLIRQFNDYPRFVGFVQGATNGVGLYCIVVLAWRLLGRTAGLSTSARVVLTITALIIGGTGADSLGLAGATTGDMPVATLVMCALVFAVLAVERSALGGRALASVLASGLIVGLAFGLKPTAGPFGLGLLALVLTMRQPWRVKGGACFLVSAAAGFLIAAGPHALTMYRLFENPVFPLFNAVFHSPYLDSQGNGVLRGTFLGSAMMDSPLQSLSSLPLQLPFLSLIQDQVRQGGRFAFRDIRLAIAIVLALIGLALRLIDRLRGEESGSRRALLGLSLFLLASACASLIVFSNYRYMGALEYASGVLIVLTLGELVGRRAWIPVAGAVALACVVTTVPLDVLRAPWGERYILVRGPTLDPDTLAVIATGREAASFLEPTFDPKIRWIRTRSNLIPPNGAGLLVETARGLVAGHAGPIVSVEIADGAREEQDSILGELQLERTAAPCVPIETNLTELHYVLCPIRKLAAPAADRGGD
jgi:hypothetical protein